MQPTTLDTIFILPNTTTMVFDSDPTHQFVKFARQHAIAMHALCITLCIVHTFSGRSVGIRICDTLIYSK